MQPLQNGQVKFRFGVETNTGRTQIDAANSPLSMNLARGALPLDLDGYSIDNIKYEPPPGSDLSPKDLQQLKDYLTRNPNTGQSFIENSINQILAQSRDDPRAAIEKLNRMSSTLESSVKAGQQPSPEAMRDQLSELAKKLPGTLRTSRDDRNSIIIDSSSTKDMRRAAREVKRSMEAAGTPWKEITNKDGSKCIVAMKPSQPPSRSLDDHMDFFPEDRPLLTSVDDGRSDGIVTKMCNCERCRREMAALGFDPDNYTTEDFERLQAENPDLLRKTECRAPPGWYEAKAQALESCGVDLDSLMRDLHKVKVHIENKNYWFELMRFQTTSTVLNRIG